MVIEVYAVPGSLVNGFSTFFVFTIPDFHLYNVCFRSKSMQFSTVQCTGIKKSGLVVGAVGTITVGLVGEVATAAATGEMNEKMTAIAQAQQSVRCVVAQVFLFFWGVWLARIVFKALSWLGVLRPSCPGPVSPGLPSTKPLVR
jgi:hypothetical protein